MRHGKPRLWLEDTLKTTLAESTSMKCAVVVLIRSLRVVMFHVSYMHTVLDSGTQ
jgi:hypothetical protein